MKTHTQAELKEILNAHKEWLGNYSKGRRADLREAYLREANLRGANLRGAKIQYAIVPSEGAFIGWKKVRVQDGTTYVLKLKIPAEAARTSNYRSCKNRAEFVETLGAYTVEGVPVLDIEKFVALHDSDTVYAIGKVTRPDSYNGDPREECTHGIHFFITQQEAAEYV